METITFAAKEVPNNHVLFKKFLRNCKHIFV